MPTQPGSPPNPNEMSRRKRSPAEIEASIEWHRIMRTQNAEVFDDLEAELRAARLATNPHHSDADGEDLACRSCGNEERGQGGYLTCQCPDSIQQTEAQRLK